MMDKSFISAKMEKSVASTTRNASRVFRTANASHKRASSNIAGGGPSRYRYGMIPTENLKFTQFLDILFSSYMTPEEIKQETKDYVQVLETNYTDKLRAMKIELEKYKKKVVLERTKSVTKQT